MKTTVSDAVRQHLQNSKTLYINGERQLASGSDINEVINAANGDILHSLKNASNQDIDLAIQSARNAFAGEGAEAGWKSIPPAQRSKLINNFADLIAQNAEILGELESLECGTPVSVSTNTIQHWSAEFIRYYAGWVDKIQGDTIPGSNFLHPNNKFLAYTRPEPLGVVAAITPWNAPIALLVLKLGPALAAGCTLVVKPSEMTPLSAVYIAELASMAGIPKGVINVVQGRGETVGHYLAQHPGVDKITFTGSTAVGKRIVQTASETLKKVSLELGGKSPFVVFPDANLEEAIPAAAIACFFLSGQNCMAGTRLYVHQSIYDEFMQGLVSFSEYMQPGDPSNPETQIGPLVSAKQRQTVHEKVTRAIQQGGKLLLGGEIPEGPGCFYPPTIIADTDPSMDVVQQEVFGPVLAVSSFDDDTEKLVNAINSTAYGLSGSVWTKDIDKALSMADAIDSGQVGINAHAALMPGVPFGGNKQSGWGREFGYEGLLSYVKTKAVTIKY